VGPGANERSNRFIFGFISVLIAIVIMIAVARRAIGPVVAIPIPIIAPAIVAPRAERTLTARRPIATKLARAIAVALPARTAAIRATIARTAEAATAARSAWRRAHRTVLVDKLGHLLELFAAQRIVIIGIKLFEHLFGRRKQRAAGATRAAGTIWPRTIARSAITSWTTKIAAAFVPSLAVLLASAVSAVLLAFAKMLTHRLAHLLALVIVQFAVTVLVEFFKQVFVHGFACGLSLLAAQLAVAVLIVLFEHFLVHFAFVAAAAFVPVLWLLSHRRSGQQADDQNQNWFQVSHSFTL
jgi:hypothetical protein